MRVYLVGGAVRDRLLGRPIGERDFVVVGATAADLLGQGYLHVGKDFPVFLHPQSGDQYALARTERKTGAGYYGFATRFSPDVTLEEDLARRDLTINAMAQPIDGGDVVDPYGGRRDLDARILRHVSPAFVEDPLRVLRVARFATRFAPLGFTIAPETTALMSEIVRSGELQALVAERVWVETERALGEAQPTVYFAVLRECGALAALFPEIDRLFGVPQPEKWHPEIDTGIHTLQVLDVACELATETTVRFAALVHDLGKGVTPRAGSRLFLSRAGALLWLRTKVAAPPSLTKLLPSTRRAWSGDERSRDSPAKPIAVRFPASALCWKWLLMTAACPPLETSSRRLPQPSPSWILLPRISLCRARVLT